MRIIGLIILITSLFISTNSFSQLSEGEYELEQEAIEYFKNKQYDLALPNFSSLISKYPGEAFYNYCYGICLVEVNQTIPKAIEYLKFASTKEVKHYVYFYLGKAHHLLYKFDEAINYYNRFISKAAGSDLKEYTAERYVEMCKSGQALIRYVSDLKVVENKIIKNQDFFYSYDLEDFGGKIIIKPNEFKTKLDKKKEDKSVMFQTNENYVYFGSYGTKGKTGKDIYRSHRLPDGTYSEFESLGEIINTPYDEDYPFLHPDGKTLYFASKGHNSMGGYDIFKSVWDSVNNKWTNPVNLDFPTNSPYDDILFVSDENEDYAYFASARETNSSQISVYKILVDKNPKEREFKNLEEIMTLAQLDKNAIADVTNNNNDLVASNNTITEENSTEKKTYSFEKLPFDPGLTLADIHEETNKDIEVLEEDIDKTETEANIAYLKADEKNKEANIKRQEAIDIYDVLKDISNEEERQAELSKAKRLEKEANILSDEAVVTYNLANNLENNANEKKNTLNEIREYSENITADSDIEKVISDINNNREKLNLSQNKYTSTEEQLAERKNDASNKSDELDVITNEKDHTQNIITSINNDIEIVNNQLKNETNLENKANLENELAELKNELNQNNNKINDLNEQEVKLTVEVEKLNNEVNFLTELNNDTKEGISKDELEEKMANIDKDNLNKEIYDKELTADLNKAKEIAENIDNSSTNNDIADNNNNENNNSSTNNITVDENTNEVVKTYKNPDAQKLFREARQNKVLADSLNNVADEMRNQLQYEDDPDDLALLEAKIIEIEELAAIKKQQAVNKFTEAQVEENNYLAANETNPPDSTADNNTNTNVTNITLDTDANSDLLADLNYIKSDPVFPFIESPNDPSIDKYNQAKYKEDFFTNQVNIIEPKLELLKSAKDTVSDPDIKEKYKTEITRLEDVLNTSKERITENSMVAASLKKDILDDYGTKEISDETYANAIKYNATSSAHINESQENDLKLIIEDRNYAKNSLDKFNTLTNDIAELEEQANKTDDHKEKKNITNQIEEKSNAAGEELIAYNKLIEGANNTEYNTYKKIINDNKVVNNDENSALASNLVNEASIYYEKAVSIRTNAEQIKDSDIKNEQLDKANKMEAIAIANQKKALSILYPAQGELVADNNSDNSTNTNTEKVVFTLSQQEQDKIDNANKERTEANNSVNEAENTLDEIRTKREKANAIYSNKKQASILKGVDEKEAKAKENLILAYRKYGEADAVKYDLNNNQLNQMNQALTEIGSNKAKSRQFKKDADFYYSQAKKLREQAENTENKDEKLVLLKQAVGWEEKALSSQNYALSVLLDDESTDFINSNTLTKIVEDSINNDDIIKISSHRIVKNLKLPEDELKALDKTVEVEEVAYNLQKDAEDKQTQIDELNFVVENSDNSKEVAKAKKQIEKIEKKLFADQFTEAELTGMVNNTKYWVYRDYFKDYRNNVTPEEKKQGRRYENNADKKFRKAQSLRERAFMDEDPRSAYKKLLEAKKLEKEAIYAQEQAYSLYLGLPPMEDEIAAYMKKKEQEKADNQLVVKSTADITPIDVDTLFPDYKNEVDTTSMLADNNTNGNKTNGNDTTNENNVGNNNTDENNTNDNNNGNNENNNENNDVNNGTNENNDVNNDNNNGTNENNDVNDSNNTTDNNNTTENNDTNNDANSSNSTAVAVEGTNVTIPAKAIFSYSVSSNSSYSNANPIPLNQELPSGIVFKVQVGAFRKAIPQDVFKGLSPISADKLPNSSFTKYLVGLFQTYEAAGVALSDVKTRGYRDAFIVAYKDGQRISLFEARNLIKNESDDVKRSYDVVAQNEINSINNGDAGNTTAANNSTNNSNNTETNITPVNANELNDVSGLLYTVQIGVYRNPVSKAALKNLDPIYQEKTSDGMIRYTTGVFNDINKAISEKNNIVRIGIRDAFVTAYFNGKRISISEAKRIAESGETFAESSGTNTSSLPTNDNSNNSSNNAAASTNIEFKVQIGAYREQVPTNVVSDLLSVASNRGLDQYKDETGVTIYTVGNYKSYDEAKSTKSTLISEGIADAFVVAYNNGKKISVEEAIKLLQ